MKMGIFFILMTATRFSIFMMLKPWINRIGWPINNKDIVVLTYGGLRGAIALSLGLIIAFDDEFSQ